MSNKSKFIPTPQTKMTHPQRPVTSTLLDKMEDGREFESLLKYQYQNLNFLNELRKSIAEIKAIRGRDIICYVANVREAKCSNLNRRCRRFTFL